MSLREHHAPVVWLDDWEDLSAMLNRLTQQSRSMVYARRCVVNWVMFRVTFGQAGCCQVVSAVPARHARRVLRCAAVVGVSAELLISAGGALAPAFRQ